jgi:hypothetical protein
MGGKSINKDNMTRYINELRKERDRLSTLRVSIPRILVPSPITRDGYPSGRDPASRNTQRRRVFTLPNLFLFLVLLQFP